VIQLQKQKQPKSPLLLADRQRAAFGATVFCFVFKEKLCGSSRVSLERMQMS
jgi:hypothetical protein